MGRPTKYKPEFATQAAKLCALGATDAQLADFFDVDETTINEWKKVHPKFSQSVKEAKAESDQLVEQALFKRATGYTRIVERLGKNGAEACTEEIPPDPTSMIFWLKNRQPKKWRDKQEHEHTGKDGTPLTPVINLGKKPQN